MNAKKIFIIGPTASGKTELAKFVFDNFKTEIISVDSVQIYKDMDIGAAKPSSSELERYPHHLINLIPPTESYSVSQFKEDEFKVSSNVLNNNKTPLLVGGTMLYFNALEYPMDDIPSSSDEVRVKVANEIDEFGLSHLYSKLLKIDPKSARTIKPNDKHRIMRAMEVYYISGKPISRFQTKNKTPQTQFNFLKIGLMPQDRSALHKRIELRTKEMIKRGFLDEVRGLLKDYPELGEQHSSMRCVGYRQILNSMNKKIELEDLTEMIVIATRQLAKRQLTWMRGMSHMNLFDPFSPKKENLVKSLIGKFLES